MSLKKNVIANYFGTGWQALMGLAFVPIYIRYLGIEAYGLIGIFALLQTWMALLDMGMKPSLSREMARFTAGAHNAQSIWDLLRSIELIGIGIAGVVAAGIWAASGSLAAHWVTAKAIPVHVVAQSFAVMGVVAALRFVEDIYASSLLGLQRQVRQNILAGATATVRALGAVGVLAWVSSSVRAFFIWQGLVSLISVTALAFTVYHLLPAAPQPARFSRPALTGIRRFAAGMAGAVVLSLLLTQDDKILLSRLLTLKDYGYFALASVVAGGLYVMVAPIVAAIYPRLTELVARGDEAGARAAYHQAAQLATVFIGAAAVVLSVFHNQVILVWTNDPALVRQVAPLIAVLAPGTMLNALMWIPFQLMYAHGLPALTIRINIVAVALQVPALLWVVPRYGAMGAAWIWLTLNAGYVIFTISLMHRRLLRGEKWRWYRQDVAIPLASATAAAFFCRLLMPDHWGRIGALGAVLVSAGCVLLAAALAAPFVRDQLFLHLPETIRRFLPPISRPAPALGPASPSPH